MIAPPLAALCPSFKQRMIDFPAHQDFFLIGSSVTTFKGKLVGAFWASNMVYDPRTAKYVRYVAPPGSRSRPGIPTSHRPPYLVTLSDCFAVEDVQDIIFAQTVDPLAEKFRHSRAGFDGPKPFEWRDQLWMDFYAGREGRDLNFFLSRLDGAAITEVHQLAPRGARRGDEKNWMPEVIDDALRYHYRLGMLIDLTGLEYVVGRQDWTSINGGTQVIPFNGGGLAIVHDFHFGRDTPGRQYRHYFVKFDRSGAPIALSEPFCLYDVEKVEVVTGLALHPDNCRAVISHGPFVADVSLDDIRAMQWNGEPQGRTVQTRRPYMPRVQPTIRSPRNATRPRIIRPGVRA